MTRSGKSRCCHQALTARANPASSIIHDQDLKRRRVVPRFLALGRPELEDEGCADCVEVQINSVTVEVLETKRLPPRTVVSSRLAELSP
jgi:hypothetical protein